MHGWIVNYLPWALSALTCVTLYLAGNKDKWSWAIGLIGQAVWFVWIAVSGTWGLLPGAVVLTIVYARNFCKWHLEARE